jgi:2-C-methyl-D-erythritol 4-phosphate cytidylyltransferase
MNSRTGDKRDDADRAMAADSMGVVVVAAGRSSRMGDTDKTFAPILDVPLIVHTLRRLAASDVVERIVLVVAAESVARAEATVREFDVRKIAAVCAGGARRQDSVRAGLTALGPCQWVAVHDGARPCISGDILARGLDAVRQCGAAVAAVPVKDTIKVVGEGQLITDTPPRATLWAAQTPQVFEYDLLISAHDSAAGEYTDDAAMVEAMGRPVVVFQGSYDNLKVTTLEDLAIVTHLIGSVAS